MPYIYADPLACTGCRICEMVCSFTYFKVLSPSKARIRVVRREPAIDLPIACRNCQRAPCMEACPTGALYRSRRGVILLDEEKCDGCGACVEACPINAIRIPPGLEKPIKCIVCGACVQMCPVGCLKIAWANEESIERKTAYVERLQKYMLNLGLKGGS